MKRLTQRFVDIWKLDFLAKFFAGFKKDHKTTIIFWIVSNAFIVLLFVIALSVVLYRSSGDLKDMIGENVPDNATVILEDGQLITQNIEDPFFREITAQKENRDDSSSFALIIDSHTDTYDITSLDEYYSGMIILRDRAYFKDGSKIEHVVFSDIPNFTLTKDGAIKFIDKYFFFPFSLIVLIFSALFLFVWFGIFRLVSAFWWALMLFILVRIFDIKETYFTSYEAVLNLYFIPTIVIFFLGLFAIHIPFLTTVIFLSIFIANLIWIKRQKKDPVVIKDPVQSLESKRERGVIENTTKDS